MTQTETKQIALRLKTSLLARLDEHAVRLQSKNAGMKVTRADAHRTLLIAALDRAEAAAE